ncbi:MAG TPA: succinyl-diaminopimelate desuccinylase [Acidimicrobiales bacterium]|nr:succinyl-diaminopimelate desuccinylase [Acidimicrobiales bacterium]
MGETAVGAAELVARTAELVDIPSVSHHERALADHLEAVLGQVAGLDLSRHGDNVVARTHLGRRQRLILAGHSDTVPPDGNEGARIAGDVVHGLGASDMKAGLAVFVELARAVPEPALDVTYVFYAGEEVEARHNGLGHLARDHPELLAGDAAVLGEPTGGDIEAGCQGSLRLGVMLAGRRAHAARPWMGVNAVHRLGPVLDVVAGYRGRRPVLDGCEFAEALQAVGVEGGVAANVVPDAAYLTLNHRFAPDRSPEEAEAHVRELLAPALGPGDAVEVLDVAAGARPDLDHPLLAALAGGAGEPGAPGGVSEVRAKLGWTDVARFAALGIPACNLGPGDPTLAHRADERAEGTRMVATYRRLERLLRHGPL